MTASIDVQHEDPPALTEALRLLGEGLWPIPITSPSARVNDPGKQPAAGKGWGKTRPTADWLRDFWHHQPDVGVGLKLGKAGGVVDIEVDDPATGESTLLDLFGGEIVTTRGWTSHRGRHLLFRWDDRLAGIGVREQDARFPGLGLRFGSEAEDCQVQSVVPPSPTTKRVNGHVEVGEPRRWNGIDEIAILPERFFVEVWRRMAAPSNTNGKPFIPSSEHMANDDVITRAIAYLERCQPAISGQGGHNQTFKVACKVGPGFGLDPETAKGLLLAHYNPRCEPPWSEKEIDHKIRDAYAKTGERGWLLGDRQTAGGRSGKRKRPIEANARIEDVSQEESTGVPPGQHGPNEANVRIEEVSQVGAEWEPPVDSVSIPAEPFPLDVFPYALQELCRVAAEVFQTPVDYFASAALAVAGGAIGYSVALKVTTTWEVAANLFLAIVGTSGSKKSPALKLMAGPLYRIDAELRREWRSDREAWLEEDPKDRGPEPVHHHLTLDDSTREAFAKHLAENHRGLILVKDELTGWVASLNAYRGGKGDDKQFWLSLNSGSLVKVTRKGTQEPIYIPRPCASVLGCIPPSCLPLIRDSARDDGWLDRILFSFPESVPRMRTWNRQEIPKDLLMMWERAIRDLWARSLLQDDQEGVGRPFFVRLTERGEEKWAQFYAEHHAQQCAHDFPQSLLGPWSKLEGFTLRFALILSQLHQVFNPETATALPMAVDVLDVWGATRLTAYFKVHFRRARATLLGRPESMSDDAWRVVKWLKQERLEEFTARDVGQKFRGFDERERADVLSELMRLRYIRFHGKVRAGGSRGRSREVYEVNPFLLEHFLNTQDSLNSSPCEGGVTGTGESGQHDRADNGTHVPRSWPSPMALRCVMGVLFGGPQPRAKVVIIAAGEGVSEDDLALAAEATGVIREIRDDQEMWRMP